MSTIKNYTMAKEPVVTAESNLNGKKDRKAREIKKASAADVCILANSLSLEDRALVCKELEKSVKEEINKIREKADSAEGMIQSRQPVNHQ
jgi:divalent metal cation (Fe/Co/Zn/Cd) transporter